MILATLCACALSCCAPSAVLAAPGDLDETFSADGLATGPDPYYVTDAAVGADGSVVVSGGLDGDPTTGVMTRYQANGDLDPSFGAAGVAVLPSDLHVPGVVTVAPDGKVYVASATTDASRQIRDFVVTRLGQDGRVDSAFGTGGSMQTDFDDDVSAPFDMQVTPAGDIVVAGASYRENDLAGTGLGAVWITPDGELDTSISGDGRLRAGGFFMNLGVIVLDGNSMYVGFGFSRDVTGHVLKVNPQGELDATYGAGGVVDLPKLGEFRGATLAAGGDLIAVAAPCAGHTVTYCGGAGYLTRLNGAGQVESSFGQNGVAKSPIDPTGLGSDDAGHIYVGGDTFEQWSFTGLDFAVERLTADGAADSAFSSDGLVTTDFDFDDSDSSRLVIAPDGKPALFGFGGGGHHVARYETAPGPPDADADALLDDRDSCPHRHSQRANGCPALATSLSLKRRAGKLVGRLRGDPADCFVARDVRVERRGRPSAGFKARTDGNGRFKVRVGDRARGRYAAGVGAKLVDPVGECLAVESDPVQVTGAAGR